MTQTNKTVAIIGAGPSGLMAAEVLSQAGVQVAVYDAMPSAGRKFLMAGKGGLNITHSEPYAEFLTRYAGRCPELELILYDFPPESLRAWVHELGISTFVGSSGRVFPAEMKAAPLLRAWLHRLRVRGVHFHMRHRWLGWRNDDKLRFAVLAEERILAADAVILAMGGASWPQLGSNGAWVPLLSQCGIDIATLKPANCGFETAWSEYFSSHFAGQPLKSVRIGFKSAIGNEVWRQGELMISEHGLEGGLIYSFSAAIRDEIIAGGTAIIYLDMMPNRDINAIIARLSQARGKDSLGNWLRKRLNLDPVKIALLREIVSTEKLNKPQQLAPLLKALPIKLSATRPLAEAISTAGGVCFNSLDSRLMLLNKPGVFCAGEMLDWEAPTGGYLLTACFASGRAAGLGALAWLGCQ
jgi:uncharacterized flavoprotein (TIGR03862 family)